MVEYLVACAHAQNTGLHPQHGGSVGEAPPALYIGFFIHLTPLPDYMFVSCVLYLDKFLVPLCN